MTEDLKKARSVGDPATGDAKTRLQEFFAVAKKISEEHSVKVYHSEISEL